MLAPQFSPFPVLETERLLLRCITTEDAPQVFMLRSDMEINTYLDKPPCASLDEAMEFVEKVLENLRANEGVFWSICLKEAPETMIGSIGFWRLIKEHYRAETGYTLLPAYWRKGIMKEALLATIDYAFTRTAIHSIEANINPGNQASAALLESCGFVQEAYFRENFYANGKFLDSVIYSLVKK